MSRVVDFQIFNPVNLPSYFLHVVVAPSQVLVVAQVCFALFAVVAE
jgi:hypothetical protein